MILEVRTKVKVVSVGIVLFVAVPPLILAAAESRPKTAAGMLIIGLITLGSLGPYFVWTTFLTKVEIQDDMITVKTPYSTRSFRLPGDIEQVVNDRRHGEPENLEVHLKNGKDRFVFLVNRFVMDVSDNRLTQLLNDLRAQVQKAKASEAAGANNKPGQN